MQAGSCLITISISATSNQSSQREKFTVGLRKTEVAYVKQVKH